MKARDYEEVLSEYLNLTLQNLKPKPLLGRLTKQSEPKLDVEKVIYKLRLKIIIADLQDIISSRST